jgi:glycosyltransferase involved in cell wall biosynthesis
MRTPAVRLRLVGVGPDRPMLEEQARILHVAERLELAGFHTDVAPDLRAADVVLIPSRYDGMALVLLEAMACGAAIVAAEVSGTSVLQGAGILVPKDDPNSAAEAIDALLADPDRRRELGRAARARVAERYAIARSTAGILALWRELGASAPGGSDRQSPLSGPQNLRRCG